MNDKEKFNKNLWIYIQHGILGLVIFLAITFGIFKMFLQIFDAMTFLGFTFFLFAHCALQILIQFGNYSLLQERLY